MINDIHAWPEFGATVRLTRYAKGSTLIGDHDEPVFEAVGVVTATPRSGAEHLLVKTDPAPDRHDEGPDYAITAEYVTIAASGLYQWTIELAPHSGRPLLITAVVDPGFANPDVIALALRGTLRGLGAALIPHTWAPDPDTVAECAGVPDVDLLELTS